MGGWRPSIKNQAKKKKPKNQSTCREKKRRQVHVGLRVGERGGGEQEERDVFFVLFVVAQRLGAQAMGPWSCRCRLIGRDSGTGDDPGDHQCKQNLYCLEACVILE